MENEAQTLETLVVKEDGPTSLESREKIKDEVIKTIQVMAPWGEMHEEFKNEKMTLFPRQRSVLYSCLRKWKLSLCTIYIYIYIYIYIQKVKQLMLLVDYVLKLLIEHNYCLLGKDENHNYHHIRSW